MEEENLGQAALAVDAAKQALYAARRDLATAVITARRGGMSVSRIAARTGLDPASVRNMLAANGLR
ncbi:helix-turn-helix domain-containing protein [Streptacidiphilus rugosus]|uniref:helix-turn-helix domain-containing protein n=1 Tax=Streptacidiphilus rugosus TaxID=405783 RepID=UPI00055A76F5|nr:helix-turn-helix domain-containing protein [Streptacidiphilus rugosus]